jgi:N-acetylglucosaminyl-diphospho-decaprenol L-rhamnosyltransferase
MDIRNVAIVTVSYNSSGQLEDFLASVRESCGKAPAVFVADNASRDVDLTKKIAAKHKSSVIELPVNVGYGQAINAVVAGLPESFEAVLIANPDLSLEPGALETLVSRLTAEVDAGAVGPRVLNPDGSVYPSARAVPSLFGGTMHAALHPIWPKNPWSVRYRNDTSVAVTLRDVGWLSGACVLVRRSAFDAIGGFDPAYFMYFEDVDLGVRLGRRGWRNVYDPAAVVTHIGGESTKSESATMIRAHHTSAATFVARQHPHWYQWPVRVIVRVGLGVRQEIALRRARSASSE